MKPPSLNALRVCLLAAVATAPGPRDAAAQSFVLASTNAVGLYPNSVITADVNGDGRPDIITANTGSSSPDGSLGILTNAGNGTFRLSGLVTNYNEPYQVVAGDFNGDGKVDLVTANFTGQNLVVFTNNGAGAFALATTISVVDAEHYGPEWLAAADFNGDGKLDLVGNTLGTDMFVFTNNGGGTFTLASHDYAGGNYSRFVIAPDINGDRFADLVEVNPNQGTVAVLLGNDDGTFQYKGYAGWFTNGVGVYDSPHFVTAADVNGDGKWDLITANGSTANSVSVLTNNGNGGFKLACVVGVGTNPVAVVAGDFNGNGLPGIVCANFTANTLTVLTNFGGGILASNASLPVSGGPISLAVADVNGDGRLDLICSSYNPPNPVVTVFTNAGTFKPRLAVKSSGTNQLVSWPSIWSGWAGWTLQQNTNLGSTNWTGFGGGLGDDGTTTTATNTSRTAGAVFFRLTHP